MTLKASNLAMRTIWGFDTFDRKIEGVPKKIRFFTLSLRIDFGMLSKAPSWKSCKLMPVKQYLMKNV